MANLKNYDFVKNEEEVLKYWEDNQCFKKLLEKNKNGKKYRFLDGPITANNKMGVHHAFGRSLKDCFLRYKAMNGYTSHYRNGFDGQGLWVEVEVEKDLGFKTKKDIEDFGLDNFTTACVERVKKFSGIITEQSKRLGQWMDWDNSYYTLSDTNITSIWYFLRKCNELGMIKETYKPMPWCIRCGTSLSEHEMTGSYHDVTCKAVFFKLPIKGKDYKALVWTTTPWTLCANVALAVNPKFDYVIVEFNDTKEKLLLCKDIYEKKFSQKGKVISTIKGSDLEGLEFETCFPELKAQEGVKHNIVLWDMVDSVEGSGIVHIAPGCGAEDFELGLSLGLDNVIPIDESGIMYNDFGFLSGKKASEVEELVFEELKRQDKLFFTHEYKHSYPYCWRCKQDIMFRLVKEWAIDVDVIRDKLIKNASTVKYNPAYQEKRMLDWLTNMGNWNISRRRFYGLPLPFYKCEKCGHLTVVGSKEELKALAVNKEKVDNLKELHRPYIDEVKIICPECGEEVSRIPQVGDVWLDAGIVPFSTLKYFEDKEYWREYFPAELVVEATEQIRLWFYSMLFMSTVLEGCAPYEGVGTYGMVVKEDGTKFSKSNKNDLSFDDVVVTSGADIIRYNYLGANRINDIRFGSKMLEDAKRKLMSFYNIVSFFDLYYEIDKPDLTKNYETVGISDKWLESRINKFVNEAKKCYENYETFTTIKLFEECSDEISNWYIKINRKKFWKSDMNDEKYSAYQSLYRAIKCIIQVMAPIIPFMSDYIWKNLVLNVEPNEVISVHLSNFPGEKEYDEELLKETAEVREIVTTALRIKNENDLKLTQPLRCLYLCGYEHLSVSEYEEILSNELNVKDIKYLENKELLCTPYLSLDFKTAGMAYKEKVNDVKNLLLNLNKEDMKNIYDKYSSNEVIILNNIEVLKDTLKVEYKYNEGIKVIEENDKLVALDVTIDEKLYEEFLYRKLLRHCQVARKEAGYDVVDRIEISLITDSNEILNMINNYKESIARETLSKLSIGEMNNKDFSKEVELLDDVKVVIELKK